jgi:hypothetical protein
MHSAKSGHSPAPDESEGGVVQSVLPAPTGLPPAPAEPLATGPAPAGSVVVGLPGATRAGELPAALLRLADADADALGDRLHDGVLQALVVARYATDAVARGADPVVARDAVQDALVALRRTVWQLRPRAASGLSAALEQLSLQQVATGSPALETEVDEALDAALDATVREAAYRLVQAVCRDADQPVGVRLSARAGRAVLDVSGTLPDPAGWSLRARALGGQLVVGSRRCRLVLPLPEPLRSREPRPRLAPDDLAPDDLAPDDLARPELDQTVPRPGPDLPVRDREAAP